MESNVRKGTVLSHLDTQRILTSTIPRMNGALMMNKASLTFITSLEINGQSLEKSSAIEAITALRITFILNSEKLCVRSTRSLVVTVRKKSEKSNQMFFIE